jgi:pyruvate-formate lyase-activating enzyme
MNKIDLSILKGQTSQTLCLAKFHESTIWLYESKIASCHHTPFLLTGNDTLTFYNPEGRRQQQAAMLTGNKPDECNYCWKLEAQDVVSDREKKSLSFKSSHTAEEYLDRNYPFKPKALELAFQNTCNLACSYCSPSFSTEWENDIRLHGNYNNISTDKKLHYQRGIDNRTPVDMTLFWKWFDDIALGLESIRITGGEPLLHEDTFFTFAKMIEVNPNVECVIHTNLCQKPLVVQRFIDNISKLNNVRINISNESAGEVAEFIRDGMVYTEWLNNLRELTKTTASLSVSTTITPISLIALDQLYLDIINLRTETGKKVDISINFATYPEFQSLAALTYEEREFYTNKYTTFFESVNELLLDVERRSVPRFLSMLDPKLTHENNAEYRKDSDSFFNQYIQRRNKKINFAELIGTR